MIWSKANVNCLTLKCIQTANLYPDVLSFCSHHNVFLFDDNFPPARAILEQPIVSCIACVKGEEAAAYSAVWSYRLLHMPCLTIYLLREYKKLCFSSTRSVRSSWQSLCDRCTYHPPLTWLRFRGLWTDQRTSPNSTYSSDSFLSFFFSSFRGKEKQKSKTEIFFRYMDRAHWRGVVEVTASVQGNKSKHTRGLN